MRSQTEKCLTALHPTPSLSLAPGCFPFQRKLRSLAILAGQDARPATPPSPLLNAPHHRTSSVNKIEKKKSLTISKTKKVSRRMAKLLKGQKSVVLPHYQQSSSFLLTPNHFMPCSAGGFSRNLPATTVFFSHAKSASYSAKQYFPLTRNQPASQPASQPNKA